MSAIDEADRFIGNVLTTGLTTLVVFAGIDFVDSEVLQTSIVSPIREVVLVAGISAAIYLGLPWLRHKIFPAPYLSFRDESPHPAVMRARLVGLFSGLVARAFFVASLT
ncbi:hypothetical protein [Trinickia acidisoli]|uniref:hypothetical protein n=1 Tax=Trinickia acidisoli TaxID=2767482 RepID=UPI001A90C218|nr:hypothetical protein [Trinickia acidisoli]